MGLDIGLTPFAKRLPLPVRRTTPSHMNRTLHRRWLVTSAAAGLFKIPNADHDNVLVTDYPIYADIAEWMMLHVHRQTPAVNSP